MKTNSNVFSLVGASNHTSESRAEFDLYCTHPLATEKLLKLERFSQNIWEPCDGLGHISDVLEAHGFKVRKTDIILREGRAAAGVEELDFLSDFGGGAFYGDIITNPPYKYAIQWAKKALQSVADGYKVAMFLRTLFLESKSRAALFAKYPPVRVWVSSSRIRCSKNGDFETYQTSAQSYSWFVWEKGYKGPTELKWFQ